MLRCFIRRDDLEYFSFIANGIPMHYTLWYENRIFFKVGKNMAVFEITKRPDQNINKEQDTYWRDNTTQCAIKYAELSGKTSLCILEAGCADGKSIAATRTDLDALGIDTEIICVDKNAADIYGVDYRKSVNGLGMKFIQGDMLTMAPEHKKYDIVAANFLYNEDKETTVKKIRSCIPHMKSDGAVIAWNDDMVFGHSRLYDIDEIEEFCAYIEKTTPAQYKWFSTMSLIYSQLLFQKSFPPEHPMDKVLGIKRKLLVG